jgi:histidyl-tRNA synthetase
LTIKIQGIRGMPDILPEEVPFWRFVEDNARSVLDAYGYREVRLPLLEPTELFRRSIGEITDIVEKEMYTFEDRNGDSLTLRPEATAGMARAGIQHGLFHHRVQRLWCIGPMFRHERPQKGRFRQFHQIDVEVFGVPGPDADAELILLLDRLWERLRLTGLSLEINTLGNRAVQADFRSRLVAYFRARQDDLDEDSRRRLTTNPLRILDSKNPSLQGLIESAPRIADCLDASSRAHFDALQAILRDCGVPHRVNPRLVRGLDYYTATVFEWVTDRLGSQGAVCGGGRYDGLVGEIGGRATPATGFAMGLERVVELLKLEQVSLPDNAPHAYLATVGERAGVHAHALAERLRCGIPDLRLLVDGGQSTLGRKLRDADRSNARIAMMLGDDELAAGTITIKFLREDRPQTTVPQSDLAIVLRSALRG